ncbi:MAG: phosphoribosyltransferase family protein [Planctomycetota bacterium]
MERDIDRVLIGRDAIAARLDELAAEVAAALPVGPDGEPEPLMIVPILTGSFIFVADLVRRLPVRMQLSLMSVTSYPGTATRSRGSTVEEGLTKLPKSLAGQHVLVVDDILDTGGTLALVREVLGARGPASVETCVLLHKLRDDVKPPPADYTAFTIPDEFVVGYGLDYDGYYRNWPEIVTLKPEVTGVGGSDEVRGAGVGA